MITVFNFQRIGLPMPASVGHIAVARKATKVVAVSVVDIMSRCVSIKFCDGPNVNFICRLANRIEKD